MPILTKKSSQSFHKNSFDFSIVLEGGNLKKRVVDINCSGEFLEKI